MSKDHTKAKIADFGISRVNSTSDSVHTMMSMHGTMFRGSLGRIPLQLSRFLADVSRGVRLYMAPEVIRTEPYDEKIDVYR